MMQTSAVLVLTAYFIQGSFLGLIDKTIPQLVSASTASLDVAYALTLCKLPFAFKFFFAPLIDLFHHPRSGYLNWLLATTALTAALLFKLDLANAHPSVSLLVVLSTVIAVSDIAFDTYALEAVGPSRALCQVVGIFAGKLMSTTVFRSLAVDINSLVSFLGLLAILLSVSLLYVYVRLPHPPAKRAPPMSISQALPALCNFVVTRPNMPWWLLHSVIPPISYFHMQAVAIPRFEQFGVTASSTSSYDYLFSGFVFAVCFLGDRLIARFPHRPLRPFVYCYGLQLVLSAAILALYMYVSNTEPSARWVGTPFILSLLMKCQDTLFYVFEIGEFFYYGQVALLDRRSMAALLTFQASVFNLADYVHSATALWVAETYSTCETKLDGSIKCIFDIYPVFGILCTLAGVLWFPLIWNKYKAYEIIGDPGWRPVATRSNLGTGLLIGIMILLLQSFWRALSETQVV